MGKKRKRKRMLNRTGPSTKAPTPGNKIIRGKKVGSKKNDSDKGDSNKSNQKKGSNGSRPV
jgi:hypothetical protein